MTLTVYLPLFATLLLPLLTRPPARVASPATTAIGLTVLAMVSSLLWIWCLGLLAASALLRPAVGDPSDPVPRWLAVAVTPLVLVLAAAGARTMGRHLSALRAVDRLDHRSRSTSAVVLLADPRPLAQAWGGLRRGRVEVSEGMLAVLDDAERAAVIAHERAHLDCRHSLLRTAMSAAVAVNPWLRGVAGAADDACERWADERAAEAVGDRAVVARALTRAALATVRHDGRRGTDAGTEVDAGGVPAAWRLTGASMQRRVDALLAPPPAPRLDRARLAIGLGFVTVLVILALHATGDFVVLI